MSAQPILFFESESAWEQWLEANHAAAQGVWLKIAKKDSGHASVTYAEALNVALCFGWIDGQAKGLDEKLYLQRFTPRRKRSNWSRINVGHAERLMAEGRMRAAGLAEVERAKADGRWEAAYDPPSRSEPPEELLAALERDPAAKAFYETLSGSNRFAIHNRLQTAKKPETRERRMAQILGMLARGEKFH